MNPFRSKDSKSIVFGIHCDRGKFVPDENATLLHSAVDVFPSRHNFPGFERNKLWVLIKANDVLLAHWHHGARHILKNDRANVLLGYNIVDSNTPRVQSSSGYLLCPIVRRFIFVGHSAQQ